MVLFLLLVVFFSALAPAFKVKDKAGPLDPLVFSSPRLRVPAMVVDANLSSAQLPNIESIRAMLADLGPQWKVLIDLRTGRPSLIEGGAIPWIPGPANGIQWGSSGPQPCRENACIPVGKVEPLARQFLSKYGRVFLLDGYDLVLDKSGSGPVWDSLYVLRFQPYVDGIIVKGASIYFRINNGNLIQVAVVRIGNPPSDAYPQVSQESAWQIFYGYWGGKELFDIVLDTGSLQFVPMTPKGMDPESFNGMVGSMVESTLVWRVVFRRASSVGTWEGLVDAATGELMSFTDLNRYGHVHGGIRPSDGLPPEENRPFPYADVSANCAGPYSDAAGNFPGTTATSTMCGRYARIYDDCGAISNATSTGDLDFLTDNAPGTDCVVPAGNPAGMGNTHSSRTLFYNLTAINLKAQIYNPGNVWLTSSFITANVNGPAWCNATSGGGTVNFYQHEPGICNNLGEIPGVAMHEWAHSYDEEDGSGGMVPPVETYADFTAIIQTHNSCTGAGFFISGNCDGYGDACLSCTGIRDCDWDLHTGHTPWTSALNGSLYTCSPGGYNGPCGWEDHCESGISTQALWDFVTRDLVEPCPGGPMCNGGFSPLDLTSAWMLEDRLWFSGVQTLDTMYTCSGGVTSGCAGDTLYTVMRALDDDGDGTANGTPHAHAIYHALDRHLIACGADGDGTNQNQTSCPTLTVTTLNASAGSNQITLDWTSVAGATRYFIFRNEGGCGIAFNRIAVVDAPATQYVDNGVVNGTTYYYRFQAATDNDSCVSAASNCVSVTPQPCAGSVTMNRVLYGCADQVDVTVLDSTIAAPVEVTFWSSVDGTPKTLTLANDPPGSAAYTGHFHTVLSGAGPDEVTVAHGAVITVRYTDPDYCGVPNQVVDGTAAVDCVAPIISGVTIGTLTGSTAVIQWTTDEPADSRSDYGLACGALTQFRASTGLVTSHTLTLTGLTPLTTYYFAVTSADGAGNSTTDTNGGACYTFTTTAISPNVFVANLFANSTLKFDPAGTYLSTVMDSGDGLANPAGVAFMLDHSLLISTEGGTIWRTDEDGTAFSVFADSSDGLVNPYALAVSFSGDIYVTNWGSSQILRFDDAGNLLNTITTGLNGPLGIAFDFMGNYVVTNYTSSELVLFDASDTFVGVIATSADGLDHPYGVVFDPGTSTWLVMNFYDSNILRFGQDGTPLEVFADSMDGIYSPMCAAWDSNGELLVSNAGTDQVLRFSTAGANLGVFADSGEGINFPWGIAVMGQLPLASSTGLIQFDADSFGCEQSAGLRVIDMDLNADPGTIETVTVLVSSTTEPAGESVVLTEQGINSSVFAGVVQLSQTDAPGILHVTDGDTLTATYNDADDGTGNPAVVTDTALVDCQPPVISNVQVINITHDSATVTWTTDTPSTSVVNYGPTPALGSTAGSPALVTSHSVLLTGLASCTTYYFEVSSTDEAMNTTTDNNGGLFYTFETLMVMQTFYDDVESGAGGWTADSPWGIIATDSHSPIHSWTDSPAGDYLDSIDISLTSQAFDLSGLSTATLTFWHHYVTEDCCDWALVEVSGDNGGTWNAIASYHGSSPAWSFVSLDLSLVAGSAQARIRFHFITDGSVTYDGWYIDDVAVQTPWSCHAGTIALDRALYGCNGDIIQATVADADLNTDPLVQETAVATIWSLTESTPETVIVTEQTVNSSFFTGTILTTPTAPVGGDGLLSVVNADTITAQYHDMDDGTGNPADVQDTAATDCQPPVISNVQVINITVNSATVTWDTDKPATSVVNYGTTPALGSTASTPGLVTSHTVLLTGLIECTDYYFEVVSADAFNNTATDNNGGVYYSFKTYTLTSVFYDDMESGLNGWTIENPGGNNLWHQIAAPACAPASHSGSTSWYFGLDGTCNFENGNTVAGRIYTPTISGLPAGQSLQFWYRRQTEGACGVWDRAFVEITTDGGLNWTVLGELCDDTNAWILSPVYDLSAYAGMNVNIGFRFDSVDGGVNAYTGWMLDDVGIPAGGGGGIPCEPNPIYQSHTILDAPYGNNDGIVDPGEIVTMPVTLLNNGSMNANTIDGHLSTATSGVTLELATAGFPDIPSLGTGTSLLPHFRFRVDPSVPCGTNIQFNLAVDYMDPGMNPGQTSNAFTVRVGTGSTGTPSNVAIFQDQAPWGLSVNEAILAAHGIAYTIFNSADMGVVDLTPFDKVVLSSAQFMAFYQAVSDNRVWFETWIDQGGNFEMHAADWDNYGGLPMPGGWTYQQGLTDNVSITAPAHPLATTPNTITDAELDGWSNSAHGYIATYPPAATAVFMNADISQPVGLTWPYGAGGVVVTGQTLEWAWDHGYSQVLENYVVYMPAAAICHPFSELLLDKTAYGCADIITLQVTDPDLNLNPAAPDMAVAEISSTTEVVPEVVILTETGANTGIFTGTITTSLTDAPGVLWVNSGDAITAVYHDADYQGGGPLDVMATAAVLPPPQPFTNVSPAMGAILCINTGNVLLDWQASANALTYDLYFGTTPAPGLYQAGITTDQFLVTGLAAEGMYYWRVVARNGCADMPGPEWSFQGVLPPNCPGWIATTPMPNAVGGITAATPDGCGTYVIGGGTGNTYYDPATLTWTARLALPADRYNIGSSAIGGTIFIPGGDDASTVPQSTLYAYSISGNSWTLGSVMPSTLSVYAIATVGNTFYLFGGTPDWMVVYPDILRYDAAGGTWTDLGASDNPDYAQAAVYNPGNGLIYITGGGLNPYTFYIYDPVAGTWNTALPQLPHPHLYHHASYADGKIFVYGGLDPTWNYTAVVDIYDVAAGTWSQGPDMLTAVAQGGSAYLKAEGFANAGAIYAFGGYVSSGVTAYAEALLYTLPDPCSTAGWIPTTVMPAAAWGLTAASLEGCGAYLIGGGTDNNYYDPSTPSWTPRQSLPDPRYDIGSSLIGDTIFIPGGDDSSFVPQSTLYAYSISGNSWSSGSVLPSPLAVYAIATVGDIFYLFGGTPDWSWVYPNILRYNATSGIWTDLGASDYPDYAQAAVYCPDNGLIYVTGGGGYPNTFYTYNPAAGTWNTALPQLPHPHIYHHAVYADGKIFVYGGLDPTWNYTAVVDIYDVAAGTWSQGPDMLMAVAQGGAAYLRAEGSIGEGAVYAFGGGSSSGTTDFSEELPYGLPDPCCTAPPPCATNPNPADGADGVLTNGTLSWSPAPTATSYDVYFGTAPPGALVGNVAGTTYTPGILLQNTTYYWTIVPRNYCGAASGCPTWSFTTSELILDKAAYDCADLVIIQLTDQGLNINPGIPDTGTVEISSTTEMVPEVVVVTETGPDTGVFTGSIPTSPSDAPGVLWVTAGDTITTVYHDPDYEGGGPQDFYATAVVLPLPGPFTNLSPPDGLFQCISSGDLLLDWQVSANALTYDLYFGTAFPPPIYQAGIIADQFLVTGVAAEGMYYWQVVARNGCGGIPGPVWSFPVFFPPNCPEWIASTTGMTNPAYGLTATTADGCGAYVLGGGTDNYYFIPATPEWNSLQSLPEARYYTVASIIGDTIYMPGGEDSGGNPVDTLLTYSISGDSWSTGPALPSVLDYYAMATAGDSFYLFGGTPDWTNTSYNILSYNTTSGTWTQLSDPYADWYQGAAYCPNDGQIYVAGGWVFDVYAFYAYDPATDTWNTGLPQLPYPHTAPQVVYADGRIFVIGGYDPLIDAVIARVDVYNIASGTWQQGPDMLTPTIWPGSAYLQAEGASGAGAIYSFGGADTGFNPMTFTEYLLYVLPDPAIPACAAAPNPGDGAIGVPVNAILSWSAAPGATSYDVYFGTSLPGVPNTNTTGTAFDPGIMTPGMLYQWKIVPRSNCGMAVGCAVWSFTTEVSGADPREVPKETVRLTNMGGPVEVVWGATCGTATDYTLYEGDLDILRSTGTYTHGSILCTDAGGDLREVFAPAAGNRYYLVVPRSGTMEGDYGYGRPRGADTAGCGITGQILGECP